MDTLDDLGLTGFADPSSSPPDFSLPRPISSVSPRGPPSPDKSVASRTLGTSPSQDRYTGSALTPLSLCNDVSDGQHLTTSGLISAHSSSSVSVGHEWYRTQPQPQSSPAFNPSTHGIFTVSSAQSSTLLVSLQDLPVPGLSTIRGGLAGPSGDSPIAGPFRNAIGPDTRLLNQFSGGGVLPSQRESTIVEVMSSDQDVASLWNDPPHLQPIQIQSPHAAPRGKRIVHGPFFPSDHDTIWIEEVDIRQVRDFLATPRSVKVNQPPSSEAMVSTTSRLSSISLRLLWRILDLKRFSSSLVRRLLSFFVWKKTWLRFKLFLRSSARGETPSSSQKTRIHRFIDSGFSRPSDEDWEAYGSCMVYYIPKLRETYVPLESNTSEPIYPPSWPTVDVVPIVHRSAEDYLLCPLLRYRPCGTAPLRWDVRSTDFGVPVDNASFMSQPATWPLCSKLVISCCADDPQPQWPWPITIYSPWGVTFHDVVIAIRENLKQAIWPQEWEALHPDRRSTIERMHLVRKMAHPLSQPLPGATDEEVLRFDYLLGNTFFRGLTPNSEGNGWMMHFGSP